ncbi:hypothetical protein [Bacillus sp. B-jedd]|uniref:hypothetical protein n=1 Tax=Bacillus sp. B-jedd TaxID=1476857 RepID=UPI0005155B94|nr:hypothetical protein [Bacillus sp. B-jedd]CEG25766.1 hypothetical protein BN1002_00583 [Bacillus sp. B-jedd]
MLDQRILNELEDYINEHLELVVLERAIYSPEMSEPELISESLSHMEIEKFIKEKREPVLRDVLFNFIDRKGATDADIYKKALIDRRHFSKIRSNPDYRPGKNTVISLALALELNKKETGKLLGSAGYSLSNSDMSDLVILFCLERKIYDIDQVNMALEYFSQKPLGGVIA